MIIVFFHDFSPYFPEHVRICRNSNDPKFEDEQVLANSADPDQTALANSADPIQTDQV